MNKRTMSLKSIFYPSLRRMTDKLKAGLTLLSIVVAIVVVGCMNPMAYTPLTKAAAGGAGSEAGEPGSGTGDSGTADPVYPPLTRLVATPYEGALGLNWDWPQEAKLGDEVILEYGPGDVALRAARAAAAGNPAGGSITLQYPQTAVIINNLTAKKSYEVKGYVSYTDAGQLSEYVMDIKITLDISLNVLPSKVTRVSLNDFVIPQKHKQTQNIAFMDGLSQTGVYAEFVWTNDSCYEEDTWDENRGGRFKNIVYNPRFEPTATVTLKTLNSSIALDDTVDIVFPPGFSSQNSDGTFTYKAPDTGQTTDLHISKNGSDYNDGSADNPMLTLNGALQRLAQERVMDSNVAWPTIIIDDEIGDYYDRHSNLDNDKDNVPTNDYLATITTKMRIQGGTIRPNGDPGTAVRVLNIEGPNAEVELINVTVVGTHETVNYSNGGIRLADGAKLTLQSGTIIKNNTTNDDSGAGIKIEGPRPSTLTMETGSKIQGNKVTNSRKTPYNKGGGGVYVGNGSTFNMNDGLIGCAKFIDRESYNVASGYQYTLSWYVEHRPPETNSADVSGGGVFVDNGGTFNMYGGTISLNEAFPMSVVGGESAKFELRYTSRGGGVFVNDGGKFKMGFPPGGSHPIPAIIKENMATFGGGLYSRNAVEIEATFWQDFYAGAGRNGKVKIIGNYGLTGSENSTWTGDYVASGPGAGSNVYIWYETSGFDTGVVDSNDVISADIYISDEKFRLSKFVADDEWTYSTESYYKFGYHRQNDIDYYPFTDIYLSPIENGEEEIPAYWVSNYYTYDGDIACEYEWVTDPEYFCGGFPFVLE
jgi:hypothetical protein